MSREIFRKTELKLYAETFSRMVLVRKGATPEDVKALTATREWQEASQGSGTVFAGESRTWRGPC